MPIKGNVNYHRPYSILLYLPYLCHWSLMLSIPTALNVCFNNVVSILNRAYVKKTDSINRVNRARSHMDSKHPILWKHLLHITAWVGALPLGDWIRGIRSSSRLYLPIKGNVREDKLLTFIITFIWWSSLPLLHKCIKFTWKERKTGIQIIHQYIPVWKLSQGCHEIFASKFR